MAKVAITEQYLKDIADAIRTRKGAIGNIATPNMANGILNIAGGTGAFKVNSIEAIANLEDMQEGDYCVVDNIDTYLLYQYNNNAWGDVTDEILYPSINVTPTTNNQTVEIPEGYKGLNVVNIDAVTSAIDANITPANIRLGASILGVDGNCEPDKPDQTKTVTPTTQEQVITADTGYELGSVVVQGVTSDVDQNITSRNIKKSVQILGVNGAYTTHAYKVTTAQEMNAITGMEVGDYCVIEGQAEYVLPQSITLYKFSQPWSEIDSGLYDDYIFIVKVSAYYYQQYYHRMTDETYVDGSQSYLQVIAEQTLPASIYISNTTTTDSKKQLWRFKHTESGKTYLESLRGKYIKDTLDYSWGCLSGEWTMPAEDNLLWFDSRSTVVSGTTYYRLYAGERSERTDCLSGYQFRSRIQLAAASSSSYGHDVHLYGARLETTTVDHLVYKYTSSGWAEVTDKIMTPIVITPTTSTQVPVIPNGYRGFNNVTVNAIQTETKTATPKVTSQTITPSVNKYLTSVTVNATPLDAAQTITPNASTQVITPTGSNIGLSSVTINPVLTSNLNITPSTDAQTFSPTGVDMGFNVVNIEAVDNTIDLNITPENIKVGVNILGITGNLEGDPEELNNAQAIVTNILEGYGGE